MMPNNGDPMKQLFDWAVANSSPELLRSQAAHHQQQGTTVSLTPQQREVLEYIASQMKSSDPFTVMKKANEILQNTNSFPQNGGTEYVFEHFLSRLHPDPRADDPEIVLSALQLLCTCLHNNPIVQVEDLYQVRFFAYLEDKLKHYDKQSKALLKKLGTAFVALSSNQPKTLENFAHHHVIESITNILHYENDDNILSKFMLSLLSFMFADHKTSILGEEIEHCWTKQERSLKSFVEKVISDFDRMDLMEKTALFLKECARYPNTSYSFVSEARDILEKSIAFIRTNASQEDKEQLLPYFEIDNKLH
ncbi:hypothetical protein C9374_003735 [Naegleria lovaniensis]|uniref:Uncharacterized protein n=1 Tax=Naegleria lovaniensis TaxID=51637 RepID=A0AA88H817_NAELO|nr:uncharacterized protein C9374_003735 [Naegleria lovaniensis]KAG2393971.1 hypothetical protein C9374_003735 [Naegleria lovaniensis]